jgi:hypothetical protein
VSSPPPRQAAPSQRRCGFLFNHDQLHQIAHSAPIAFELMRRPSSGLRVDLLASTPAQYGRLRDMLAHAGLPHDRLVLMRRPLWMRAVGKLLDPLLPFSRVVSLLLNGDLFRQLDLLVAPEKTSLVLRRLRGMEGCKFVHTRHGAGDREVGFNKQSSKFDLVLMSGPKIRDRLDEQGLLHDTAHAIVGYPKFDLLDAVASRPRLFDNDRPTILYNPHCSPFLSSWFKDGEAVLEAFYRSDRYNLIFAPHVMLFSKRVQFSLKPWRVDRPGRIAQKYLDCPHIHVDLGSERSSDMTYTEAADGYIGDVSSQIYEFLRRPRPCVFLDSHRRDWQGDANYRHWLCGPVVRTALDMTATIDRALATHAEYIDTQRELFAYSIDIQPTPSSQRAAQAIEDYAQRTFGATARPSSASSDSMRSTVR